jgi:glycine oxidase
VIGNSVHIMGIGIAGLWQALLLAKAGFSVSFAIRDGESKNSIAHGSSWWAGGMLAPDCEAESAEPIIAQLGTRSLTLWRQYFSHLVCQNGSLVVAQGRDKMDLERFARLTPNQERLDSESLAALEPDLSGRFSHGLFYRREAHIEPRLALSALSEALEQHNVTYTHNRPDGALCIDCRGLGARADWPDLRGVKGETVTLETKEIRFSRPIRLLHPRFPLYLVPRSNGHYLLGATTIENEEEGVTMRSAMELMNAAYAVHPAFAEAKIIELGCGLRPAFPDHRPRIRIEDKIIRVNGLYRHGFLIAPALAQIVRDWLLDGKRDEVMI